MLRFIKRQFGNSIESAALLSEETGFDISLCKLLCIRGITEKKAAEEFLRPSFSQLLSPFLFREMKKATERLLLAKERGERVCIYGDYDVDGICATAILYLYFTYEGMNVTYYIPSRKNEGYGMNIHAIERLHEDGVNLIVTVDNGIVAHKETEKAYELGMQVIITDHHKSPSEPPKCEAVICHSTEGETYPNHDICGAATALKVVQALGGDEAAKQFLPYAGLATVADVVSLTGENRAIVSLALSAVNEGNCPVGLRALCEAARPNSKAALTERDFAFGLAPRLNAAGRMGNADVGAKLLCEHNSEKAAMLAVQLDMQNTERRDEEQKILADAEKQIQDIDLTETRIIILSSPEWNPGIVGIAAAKIAERYYRPCILFTEKDDFLTGSARSIPEIDLYDAMYCFSDMYIKFGGHSFAAGVTLPKERLAEYREKINRYITDTYPCSTFIRKRVYDFEADTSDITLDFINAVKALAPYGEGNPQPVLLLKNAKITELRRVGAELNHINGKVVFSGKNYDFVSFDSGKRFDELLNCESCDMLFVPSENTWGRETRIQLRVSDIRTSSVKDAEAFFKKRQDLFEQAFLNNLMLKSKCNTNPAVCTGEQLISIFKSTCDGTLVLCADAENATYIYKLLSSADAEADVCFNIPTGGCLCCNTVLCAPVISDIPKTSRFYKKIVVCGSFSDFQLSAICNIFKDAQVSIMPGKESSLPEMFKAACSRDVMGKIYTAAIKFSSERPRRRDELCRATSAICKESFAVCDFCIGVFMDLDLFFFDNNDRINANTDISKQSLANSCLYNAAADFVPYHLKQISEV